MYKKHFGLERRIFRGNAAGADVFVGPQTASILSSIKKAVSGTDAVITLTGPVGCGKSTAVAHSLSAVSGKNAIVRVGRFPLQRGELLDLMFDHMRIQQRPQRGNQKLALFRQLLFNLAQNDSRMFVLVEDAPFLGPDMLAELEVVTAADTGPSDGAAVVLMGDEYLKELLASKSLARLRQRIRLRRKLEPCGIEELGGYLRHCFRQAGGDFDKIFTGGSVELLHELSGGILRVANNLVESSMEATAHAKVDVVALDVIRQIADEEFGLTGKFSRLPEIGRKQPEPRHTDDATAELVALSLPEPGAAPAPPVPAQGPEEDEDDIPELIQDTQPSLAILNDAPPPAKAPPQKRSQDTLPDIDAIAAELAESAKPEPAAIQTSMPDPKAQPKPAADAQAKPRGKPDAETAGSTAKPSQPVRTEKKPAPAPAVKAEPKPEIKPTPEPAAKAEAKPEPKPEPAPALKAEPKPEPAPVLKAEPKPEPKPEPAPALGAEPKPEPKPEPAPAAKAELPDLVEPEFELELELEPDKPPTGDATVPTLSDATGTVATPSKDVSGDDDKPDWDRDPTLAELRPDLDALERAMAVAQGRDPESGDDPAATLEPIAEEKPQDEVEDIPEITLDASINRKVDRAELERKKRLEEEGILEEEEPEKEEVAAEDRAREEKAAAELEKIAAGLAKAKTIEDVDDKMAETLFGEELSVAAAAVAARVAEEAAAAEAEQNSGPAEATTQEPAGKSEMEKEFENVWGETPGVEVSIESQIEDQKGGLDISASQRLATVRALNTGNAGTPEATPQNAAHAPPAPGANPDPIEEQITTSLTQTMKALKVAPEPTAVNDDDDDDDDERKGGFFSRFRRS
jgi:type II secretory pathway predicted ATPase ExeA